MSLETKVCKKCGREMPATLEYFHKRPSNKCGLDSKCKKCINKTSRVETKISSDGNKVCSKCGKSKPYTLEFFCKDSRRADKLTAHCRDCNKILKNNWSTKNRDVIKKASRKSYIKNKNSILKKITHRRKHSMSLRLADNLRRRINKTIRGSSKSSSTMTLLGCTVEELREHLASKFVDGMSWDNYGFYGWHIDHIKPCASFYLSKEDQQQECFHYTNLQPLWAKDNLSKGDRY